MGWGGYIFFTVVKILQYNQWCDKVRRAIKTKTTTEERHQGRSMVLDIQRLLADKDWGPSPAAFTNTGLLCAPQPSTPWPPYPPP